MVNSFMMEIPIIKKPVKENKELKKIIIFEIRK